MNVSLHIGVNKYDPAIYGTGADLRGCVNDATNMHNFAKSLGFQESWVLFDDRATKATIKEHILEAAKRVKPGETFLLSYSCHGTQVKDHTFEERDKLDEALCMYDGLVYDDYIARWFALFPEGAKINVVSDTCHSEDQVRRVFEDARPRFITGVYEEHEPRAAMAPLKASVIQYAACRSTEVAWDEGDGGAFTKTLLRFANDGRSRRPSALMDTVKRSITRQTPVLTMYNVSRPHRMTTAFKL